MTENDYLFPILEIEQMILEWLDPFLEYKNLILLNHYFYELITNDLVYLELKEFLHNRKKFASIRFFLRSFLLEEILFLRICKKGYLRLAKRMYKIHPDINIHVFGDFIFQKSCQYGHLHIIKFLLSLEETSGKINIHNNCELAFIWSCEEGHLEVAQFLYEIGRYDINIHADHNAAFLKSTENKHLDVVMWLASLDEDYRYLLETQRT